MDMKYKICKRCGQKFMTNKAKQVYCNMQKTSTCPICKQEFTYLCSSFASQTCGNPQCQSELIRMNRTKSVSTQTRICKWCGKEFTPKNYHNDLNCNQQLNIKI